MFYSNAFHIQLWLEEKWQCEKRYCKTFVLFVCLYSGEGRDTILLFLVQDDVYPALVDSVIIVLYINGTRDLLTNWPTISFSEVPLYRVITPRLSAVCRGKPSLPKTRHRSIVNNRWVLPEAIFPIPASGTLPLI